jgi:hypothetical protein
MSLVCAQCSRVNPSEAAYCFYDGAALAGRAGGPINAGAAPFPSQFVFPNGLACRNFDQLAMACQQHWTEAINLLRQGYLGSFFGGMGRVDLAMAAQEAAKYPDLDRGLDQLLTKLPTQALQEPRLQAEPSEINLGRLKIGDDRALDLHLSNLGMRLLYGTATSDCKWLTLGEAPGHAEKLFQFGSDSVIHVHVRGKDLRAGSKPLEGHLTLDSNGGAITVTVRADVPITPYEGGMFAGAVTPRQIAEKAKANPKEASPYFEKGDIARWYAANGWAYPVQGPIMSGMGAIQQFFEALGVAKPPKVEVNPKTLNLAGAVGKTLETTLEVTEVASKDKRKFVYGWATCDQHWVEVGASKLTGKSATIPITIRIPSPAPPTLDTTLQVTGNGQQKLSVPLQVTVAGGKAGVTVKPPEDVYAPLEIIEEEPPVILEIVDDQPAMAAFAPEAPQTYTPPIPTAANAPAASNGSIAPGEAPSPFAISDAPARSTTTLPAGTAAPPARLPLPVRIVIHLIPVVLLSMCLLSLLVRDIFTKADPGKNIGGGVEDLGPIDSRKFVMIKFDEGRAGEDYTDSMNFAVHKLDPDNPNVPSVKLNWYPNGFGNSIVARIDNQDYQFGVTTFGLWAKGSETGIDVDKQGGKKRSFLFQGKGIMVTQTVTIVPTDPVEVKPGEFKRLPNTCLARYEIKNMDTRSHNVGLRIVMDTCIGDKDDVPFMFPGVNEPVATSMKFESPGVPDFVQVLERPSLRDPGTVVQLGLRVSDKFEAPTRLLLTRYPGALPDVDKKTALGKWEVPVVNFGNDSSIVMYWDIKDMKPKGTRELAFTYGLGTVSADEKLGLTIGGSPHVGGELSIVALIADPAATSVTVTLPKNLELDPKTPAKQDVTRPRPGPDGKLRPTSVTWRVRVTSAGADYVSVQTDTNVAQKRRVTITAKSLFN